MSDPLLSVVVPVYRVRALLRDCLDSVLDQSFRDFELIAVDDASPDGSGAILDEYAAADPRVRVLHLEVNVGLGQARNAALDVARGRYLAFVDSDDLLVPGALRKIADRITDAGDPDIVLFDYARLYWDGREVRNILGGLFSAPGPDVVTVRDRPELLTLLMVVWNKVYRRDFVDRHGFRFPTGFYEDLPWTYPTMITASRIALLDEVLYLYRQRRSGNILRSQSRKHFDVFDQYRRVFDYVDSHDDLRDWHGFFFDRMLTHCIEILINERRISADMQREFFAETAAMYRRYKPADYRPPTGRAARLRVHAVSTGDFRALQAVQVAQGTRAGLRSAWRLGRRGTRTWSSSGRRALLKGYSRAQRRLPIDAHLAYYAADGETGYGCNPAAIYERAREDAPGIRGVWVVRRGHRHRIPADVDVVEHGSPAYLRLVARAKFFVSNVDFPADIVKRPGQVFLQTHTGTPVKAAGLQLREHPIAAAGIDFAEMLRSCDRWDFSLSANRFSTDVWERAYPSSFTSLEYGYPRNDRLVRADDAAYRRQRARLAIAEASVVVLYAPTRRDWDGDVFDPSLDLGTLGEKLGEGWTVLVRGHGYRRRSDRLDDLVRRGLVRDVSDEPSIQDLMIAADVLVTDYSSVMADFALLDRPIVVFADDRETFTRVRGLNLDPVGDPPGVVETTTDGVVDALRSGRFDDAAATRLRTLFRARLGEFDDGRAAERVVRRVFLGEPA